MSLKNLVAELEKELMKETGSGPAGIVQYLKSGEDYKIKFVMPKGKVWDPDAEIDEKKFWATFVETNKDGSPKTSVLVPGVVIEADNDKAIDTENIKYIKMSQTGLKALFQQLGQDWDLFSDEGTVFNCRTLKAQPWFQLGPVKKGKAFQTFDSSNCKYPDISLEEAAENEANKAKGNTTKSDKVVLEEEDLPF